MSQNVVYQTFLIRRRAMPYLLGYARVSTTDQNADLQFYALRYHFDLDRMR